MDFFSGSVPRKLIPFRLGMADKAKESSDRRITIREDVVDESFPNRDYVVTQTEIVPTTQSSSQASGGSSSDVNTYAERFISSVQKSQIESEAVFTIHRPVAHVADTTCVGGIPNVGPQVSVMNTGISTPTVKSAFLPIGAQKLPDPESSKDPAQFDNDSDLLSLVDCSVLPTSTYPQTDASETVEIRVGEPSAVVLHKDTTPDVNYVVPSHSDVDADMSGNDGELEATRLNSMDPFPGLRHLSGRSRGMLKEFFEKNVPIQLPRDHPTLALSEDQAYQLLRIVSDEAARSSLELIRPYLAKSGNVSGRVAPSGSQTKPPTNRRVRSQTPARRAPSSTTEEEQGQDFDDQETAGYTSGFVQSGDSDVTLGPDSSVIEEPISQEEPLGSSTPKNPTSQQPEVNVSTSSSLDKPLSSLFPDSQDDSQNQSSPPKETRSIAVGDPPPKARRGVSRPGKIFKEAYFHKIEWTRTFVSGPMDPLDNPYCFYCQICQCNVSIYGKGAAEVRRHYSSRKHFRKDQKWRYTHLVKVDPVSGESTHAVRDKNGKLLNKLELALELPLFENEELVEVGEKFPFYEDIARGGDAQITSQSRAKTQLCLLGDYLRTGGNISQLRGIWTNVGNFTNHQSMFADFDWSDERLSVSSILFLF